MGDFNSTKLEFSLINTLKNARIASKLTKAQIAEKMGANQSLVTKLEANPLNAKLGLIMRYARAVGLKELRIAL